MLWLVASAKSNSSERYGIERMFKVGSPSRYATLVDRYASLEESYHTRILQDVVRCFGLDFSLLPPPLPSRLVIELIVRFAESWALPATMAAEVVGVAGFKLLLLKGRELTAGNPAVQQRVTELYQQILVDEIGHVAYCRARLGPTGLALARALMGPVMTAFANDLPEVTALFGRERFISEWQRFDLAEAAELCPHPPFWTEPLPVSRPSIMSPSSIAA